MSDFRVQRVQNEEFTVPHSVDLRDCVDIYNESLAVVENLCVYLCQGKKWSPVLEIMMHIHYMDVKDYVKIRTPETDAFVKACGDGTRNTMRFVKLCHEYDLDLEDMKKYIGIGNLTRGLLLLAGYVLTGVELNHDAMTHQNYFSYKDALQAYYPDKSRAILDVYSNLCVRYGKYIGSSPELDYFVDTLLATGATLTHFSTEAFRNYTPIMLLNCANLLKEDESLLMYTGLGFSASELETVIRTACRSARKSTKKVGILDIAGIELKELKEGY